MILSKGTVYILGPFMGKNEENEDASIATSSRGFKNSENRGFDKSEDRRS